MASFRFPTTVSAANYVQVAGDSFYPTRRTGPALGIVLHVTAGLQDLNMEGADNSAEGTAKWAINREVSWHAGVDSDSIIPCLPSTYTGWHAKGYNSRTIGIEISNLDARWDNKPADWVEATLRNAAKACAAWVAQYNFPLVRATRAQVDSAIAANRKFGFTYHSYLSDIRVDPGKTFPWDRFIAMVAEELGQTPPAPKPPVTTATLLKVDGSLGPATIKKWQAVMKKQGATGIVIDGVISRPSNLIKAVQTHLNAKGMKDSEGNRLAVDGLGVQSNSDGRYPTKGTTNTIEALQRYLGSNRDGHFSKGDSSAVRALQRRLNTGKF